MVQMGDREACDRVFHNLNGAACFGSNLSVRYDLLYDAVITAVLHSIIF